jgi:hypothetical protein
MKNVLNIEKILFLPNISFIFRPISAIFGESRDVEVALLLAWYNSVHMHVKNQCILNIEI